MSKTTPFSAAIDRTGAQVRVVIAGSIRDDVTAELKALAHDLASDKEPVEFDFGALEFVNSMGIGCWKRFADAFKMPCSLVRCTSYFVEYLNVYPEIVGRATVASIFVPYACASCAATYDLLRNCGDIDRDRGLPPEVECPNCRKAAKLEVDPHDFIAFLT